MRPVAIVGAGPAGLAAAESVAAAGLPVVVFDSMPTPGRKLQMAGLGGLNITHSEPAADFMPRYAKRAPELGPMIEAFSADDMRTWCAELGEETFVGTSGRVFPKSFKASPLLRAWLAKLAGMGVELRTGQTWTGWNEAGALTFADGSTFEASGVVLAMGGASWPRLGSTGDWADKLAEQGVRVAPFTPSNCGFAVEWSEQMLARFEGKPIKNVEFRFRDQYSRAEAIITKRGLEGGAIYALSAALRDAIAKDGPQTLQIDLLPEMSWQKATTKLAATKAKDSSSNRLRKGLGLSDVQRALFFEAFGPGLDGDVPHALKTVPLELTAPFGLDRAISSGGGVAWDAVDSDLQLLAMPGVYAAGEMLDWEAPTGGYLLQGCVATGRWAGSAIAKQLQG